jgi:hypothetical protein
MKLYGLYIIIMILSIGFSSAFAAENDVNRNAKNTTAYFMGMWAQAKDSQMPATIGETPRDFISENTTSYYELSSIHLMDIIIDRWLKTSAEYLDIIFLPNKTFMRYDNPGIIYSSSTFSLPNSNPLYLEILAVLYQPNADWDRIVEAASRVPITVIIDPNDGPIDDPSAEYLAGIQKLRHANVTVLGYVYTDYGARNPNDAKADIEKYKQFDIDGIYLDEVPIVPNDLEYYKLLSNYVRSSYKTGIVFLNPGWIPDERYIRDSVGDKIQIFEGPWSNWLIYQPDNYINKYGGDRFCAVIYATPSASSMKSSIDLAFNRGINCILITDRKSPYPYVGLPSFWDALIDYVAVKSRSIGSMNNTHKLN